MTDGKKVALVTGASGGLGGAMAKRLGADGLSVAVHYHSNTAAAEAVVQEIRSNGGHAKAFQADVSKLSDIEALFATVESELGNLHVFVNNIGIPAKGMTIAETDEAVFDHVFSVNTKAALFALKQAARRISDGGRIINISSSTTYFPSEGLAVYAASKAAMMTFTEVLAKELGPRGVTVNTIAPGPTVPGMFDWAPDDLKKHAASLSPFNRLGAPDDIAGAVAFLASDDARWITGQHLLVNGGATI